MGKYFDRLSLIACFTFLYDRDAIFKPPACAMASDSSDSEFEGFLRDENQPTLNTLNTFNESDIDVSEVSSVSDHSSDGEDDVDNAADAGPVEWQAETTPVVITPFTQPTHLNHQLADDANPLATVFIHRVMHTCEHTRVLYCMLYAGWLYDTPSQLALEELEHGGLPCSGSLLDTVHLHYVLQ